MGLIYAVSKWHTRNQESSPVWYSWKPLVFVFVSGKREEKKKEKTEAERCTCTAQRPMVDPRFFSPLFLSPWLSRVRRRGCNSQPNTISFIAESKRNFVDKTDTTDTQVRNPLVPDRKIHQLLVVEKHCTWVYPTIVVPPSC